MIKTREEAVDAIETFKNQIREMDMALCRKGGHPDEAWWITDKRLHEQFAHMQKELSNLITWILGEK